MNQVNHSLALPPGYRLIPVKTTYLEMTSRPETEPVVAPAGCRVERWEEPGSGQYRALFKAVGSEWGWSGRLIMEEEELKAIIRAKTDEIYRLYCEGKVAGFVELDRSVSRQAEIAYFGLVPAFIGRGLGKFFLDWAVRRAWLGGARRVWLHTCQYDHAGALSVYLKAGFTAYDEKVEMHPYAQEFLDQRSKPGG